MKIPLIRTGKRGWRTTLHAFYYTQGNTLVPKQTRMILYGKQSSNPGDANPTEVPLPLHSFLQPFAGERLTSPAAKTGAVLVNCLVQKTLIMFGLIQESKTVNGIDCCRKR